MDDVRLVIDRCLAGEESAMLQLVETYKAQVLGLCYRMLNQWQDAEDVAQETFTRALRSLGSWDSQREFTPWLLAIAANRCRTMLATRKRRPAGQPLFEQIAANDTDQQGAKQLFEEVQLGLANLREEYRAAFVLFHEQELSYAEIADRLNCPLGTVKTWVHRARRELAAHLQRRGVVQESNHEVRNI